MSLNRALTSIILAALALYGLAGLFAQPLADDVNFINLARLGNPIAQQYATWQGRYGYSLLMGVVMPVAPNFIVRLMPTVLIVSMVYTGYKLARGRVANPLLASSGLTLAFMLSMPNVWQSLYWMGGSANYLAPLVLGMAVLTWLIR